MASTARAVSSKSSQISRTRSLSGVGEVVFADGELFTRQNGERLLPHFLPVEVLENMRSCLSRKLIPPTLGPATDIVETVHPGFYVQRCQEKSGCSIYYRICKSSAP